MIFFVDLLEVFGEYDITKFAIDQEQSDVMALVVLVRDTCRILGSSGVDHAGQPRWRTFVRELR